MKKKFFTIFFTFLKKIFTTCSENWTHKLTVIWNSSCCSRDPPPKNVLLWEYLTMALSFIFQFQIVPFASFLFWGTIWPHSYCTVVWKLVELSIFVFPFIDGLKRLLHFLLFKLMIDLLVTCLLGLRLFSKKWGSVHFSLKTRKVGKMEGWRLLRKSNLGLLLIFVFVNLRNTITQGIHKIKFKVKFKFHIYIYIYTIYSKPLCQCALVFQIC